MSDAAGDELSVFTDCGIERADSLNCGVANLNRRLPELLSGLITTNLPILEDSIYQNLSRASKELEALGEIPRDGHAMVDRIRDISLKAHGVRLKERSSEIIDRLIANIQTCRGAITEKSVLAKFGVSYFEPPIFQGQELFNECVAEVAGKWDAHGKAAVSELSTLLLTSVETNATGASYELAEKTKAEWAVTHRDIMQKMGIAVKNEIDKEYDFATANHYLTANFETNMRIPDKVISQFSMEINEQLESFRKRTFADRRARVAGSGNIVITKLAHVVEDETRDAIVESLAEKLMELHSIAMKTYLDANLREQQARRLYALFRAYCKVMKKNFIDNYLKAVRDVMLTLWRKWLTNVMPRNGDLLSCALENKTITQKRKSLVEEIKNLKACKLLLQDIEKC